MSEKCPIGDIELVEEAVRLRGPYSVQRAWRSMVLGSTSPCKAEPRPALTLVASTSSETALG